MMKFDATTGRVEPLDPIVAMTVCNGILYVATTLYVYRKDEDDGVLRPIEIERVEKLPTPYPIKE